MKTLSFTGLLLILTALLFFGGKQIPATTKVITFTIHEKVETITTIDTLTYYNPEPRQTDSTPLITASLARIDTSKLKTCELRWMAVSQKMIRDKIVAYGDTVEIVSNDPDINGQWIIQDCMNKRFDRWGYRGDLLLDKSVKSKGRWLNVKLIKRSYKMSKHVSGEYI